MQKTIHFQGKDYDPMVVLRLAGQGQRLSIENRDVSDITSFKEVPDRIATIYAGKYHLLTGRIDPTRPMQDLVMLTKHVLKKAQVFPSYQQRREDQLAERNMPNRNSPGRWSIGSQLDDMRLTTRRR